LYEQTDGVAMGSPLSPLITNVLLEDFEERALEQALCWFCYVDGTFVIWPRVPEKLERFLHSLNGIHRNINFTSEAKKDGQLPFLDIHRRLDGPLGHRAHTSARSLMALLPIISLSLDFTFHFLRLLFFSALFIFLFYFIYISFSIFINVISVIFLSTYSLPALLLTSLTVAV
jgi:Reverse transcriptase (RNA-dependent DNA polymerase).